MKAKKILSVLFVFVFLFCSIPFSTSAVEIDFYGDVDTSSVETDLLRMGYDLEDYTKDVNAEYCRFVTFLEYGYEYDGTSENYGLYVYLYNPSGKRINTSDMTITMQALGASNNENDGSGLTDYKLIYCDNSLSVGYEYVFYKFKVGRATNDLHSKLSRDMRHYQIDSISFVYSGEMEKRVYEIGGRYSFIGYMPYCNKTKSSTNSLQQVVTDVTAVDIELHPVTWKTQTSDKGAGYSYAMYSVYFAIPNEIIKAYGNKNDITKGLKEIRGEFEEYKINGLITPDTDVYNNAYKYMNRLVSEQGNSNIPISFCTEYSGQSVMGNYSYQGNKKYNLPYATKGYGSYINKYVSVFKYDYDTFSKFSSLEVIDLLNSIWNVKGFMDMGTVEAGRIRGNQSYRVQVGMDLTSQIATYASANKWLQAWLKGEGGLYIQDEVYEAAESIEAITYIDSSKDDADVAAELFIEEDAVDALRVFVAESNAKNKTTFIMRFAVRDYYCAPAYVVSNGKTYGDAKGNYYYEMTMFKNLDIFTFEFQNKYQKSTIIPVVAEPIDVIPSVETTKDPEGNFKDFVEDIFKPSDKKDNGLKDLILTLFAIFAGFGIGAVTIYVLNKLGFDVIGFVQSVFYYLNKAFRFICKWIKKGFCKIVSFLKKL